MGATGLTTGSVDAMVALSVIICTHNPRKDYLSRTLAALQGQTFPRAEWELIVIDNASREPVGPLPFGRIVKEDRQGLTYARLRGIAEAAAPLLVFVDDDNILSPDYLASAVAIAHEFPTIGVFGGQSVPEFETSPPDWLTPFYGQLALVEFDRDMWSNQRDPRVFPIGAGMCIRRPLALTYAEQVGGDPRRQSLGRRGTSLMSGEDTDMVLTCLESGFGAGRFSRLRLTHLIPRQRLDYAYNRRLAYATGYSAGRLGRMHGGVSWRAGIMQGFRTLFYLGFGSGSWRSRWISAAANYGYLRGLIGRAS